MSKTTFHIFVSSTYMDLILYRKAAEHAINDLGEKYQGMEYMGAMTADATTASLDLVEQCDLFVGIYAWRYGYIPCDCNISITEQEYHHAIKLGRPCLCYFVDDDHSWPPKLIESGKSAKKLQRFKNTISQAHVRARFTDPDSLKYNLVRDLGNWVRENKPTLRRDGVEAGADPAKKYRQAIADKYATLAMLGFKRSFAMDGIYIPLTVHLDPECRQPGRMEELGEKWLAHALKAEDLVTLPDKVTVVLGEPGMGKTTMVQYLARRQSHHPAGLLPIVVKLAEFSKVKESLEAFLLTMVANHISGPAMQDLALTALQQGQALVLLDGLDEVNREQYNAVTERIRAFICSHGQCRVIITSRKAGFQGSEVPYRIFEIDRLPLAEIKTFVAKWFDHKTDLAQRIETNARIYELAQNPFLLSIICLIFEKDQKLPERRIELYEKSAVTLLTLYDERQVPKVNLFTRQLKEQVLEDLAYHFFCTGLDEFPYAALIQQVSKTLAGMNRKENEENILREIRENSGLLQQSDDRHLFVHRTFYEYYVARKMHPDAPATVLARAKEPRWEEPVRLYAAQIEPTEAGKQAGSQFLRQLWDQDQALALRCYPDLARVVQPELIKELLHQAGVEARVQLVKGLPEKIADPARVVETLRELFRWETNGEVLYWGVEILEKKATPEALEIVRRKLDEGAEERYRQYLEKDLVEIPAGAFRMGSTEAQIKKLSKDASDLYKNWIKCEKPQHTVWLDAFLLSRYPVTNRLYEQFDPEHHKLRDKYSQADDQPVLYVSWYEAAMFCRWLGCQLPTEAQWEKAARGGRDYDYATQDGTIHPKLANYSYNVGTTTPVGQYPANPYGLYDMSGNVYEWCQDWLDEDYYQHSPEKNPAGPDQGSARVLRGGSWLYHSIDARSADRDWYAPQYRLNNLGFRCSRAYL